MAVQPLYQLPSGETYLFLGGEYCPFQDASTQQAVCGSSPTIQQVSTLPAGATTGPTIADGSCTWNPSGTPGIFLLVVAEGQGQSQALRFWIQDPPSLEYYQLTAPVQSTDPPLSTWLLATPVKATIAAPS
jgi:hypothetical protein